LRLRRGTTKYALRQAARPWLPAPLLRRAKQGFMFPVAYWLDGRTLRRVASLLAAGGLVRAGWIEPAAIERLAVEHEARRADHHVRLWLLMSLQAWFRIHIETADA
jgi:asparagine synthase (glutamine-hydrolysing)